MCDIAFTKDTFLSTKVVFPAEQSLIVERQLDSK
jgi:hypothetical protein